MPLFISGAQHKKIQKFAKSKTADFVKIPEIRPISGQAFFSFIIFHPGNMWQKNRNYLDMSLKNIESFLRTFEVPGGFFVKI
jgi:hypothetical protein